MNNKKIIKSFNDFVKENSQNEKTSLNKPLNEGNYGLKLYSIDLLGKELEKKGFTDKMDTSLNSYGIIRNPKTNETMFFNVDRGDKVGGNDDVVSFARITLKDVMEKDSEGDAGFIDYTDGSFNHEFDNRDLTSYIFTYNQYDGSFNNGNYDNSVLNICDMYDIHPTKVMISDSLKLEGKSKLKPKPTKDNVAEYKKYQLAKKTMKLSDSGADLLGGMTKKEAEKYLKQFESVTDEQRRKDEYFSSRTDKKLIDYYIPYSSIFVTDLKYDINKFVSILDAENIKYYIDTAYGWSNQPEVVCFRCTKLQRINLLKIIEEKIGNYIFIIEKDFSSRTDKKLIDYYIPWSSIFDTELKYDINKFVSILDAENIKYYIDTAYGWSNQPEVVCFRCTKLQRINLLKIIEEKIGNYIFIIEKDWKTDLLGTVPTKYRKQFENVDSYVSETAPLSDYGLDIVEDERTGLFGLIDANGQEVLPMEYSEISSEINVHNGTLVTYDRKGDKILQHDILGYSEDDDMESIKIGG